MGRSNELRVTIATIKFQAPLGRKPRTMTVRHAVLHRRKNAAKAQEIIKAKAEEVKLIIETENEGIAITYTIKMEQVPIDFVSAIDEDIKED